MSNDITVLAQREMEQREKFEAWTEESCALPWGYLKKRRTYDGFYSEHTYTSLWAAWKAASMALVEALEKAQQYAKERDEENQGLMLTVGRLRTEREALESRTVTVKLPKAISVLHRRDFIDAHRAIYAYPEAELNAALAAAGIQVIEGEGQ